jgi:hypothetical protein
MNGAGDHGDKPQVAGTEKARDGALPEFDVAQPPVNNSEKAKLT